jgi:NAD-dependent deacetylase
MDWVAFTGAGISAASGIPTFEELGQDFREKLSREYWKYESEDFFSVIKQMKRACDAANPNAAHQALAKYDIPVITMNIDGLHRRAGTRSLIEIHGSMEKVDCSVCGRSYDFDVTDSSIYCPACGGLLNTRVVLYGDDIPQLQPALRWAQGPGTLLVIGTSFYTSTAT